MTALHYYVSDGYEFLSELEKRESIEIDPNFLKEWRAKTNLPPLVFEDEQYQKLQIKERYNDLAYGVVLLNPGLKRNFYS